MAKRWWRTLVIAHRYLGVVVGALMVTWFLSGIVMMYVGFPRVDESQRARALAPISWQSCCDFGEGLIGADETIVRAQLENLAGIPALRLQRPGRPDSSFDLAHGARIVIDAEQARAIAREEAPRIIGRSAQVVSGERVDLDQWTMGQPARNRPFYRVTFDNPGRTVLYVSGATGQIVLWTTATQRFWNWLGAIPHFLYFVELRRHPVLWSQVVIWSAVLGVFLVVLGLYLAVAQFRRGPNNALSPYHGWFYWHHVLGLIFGLVTLSWVASGLISMNPWGFLDTARGDGAQARVQGAPLRWSIVRSSLDAVRLRPDVVNAVSLRTVPLDGQLYWLATRDDGTVVRLDAAGHAAPANPADLAQAAARIAGAITIAQQGLLDEEDAYYFKRGRTDFVLPVYRVILGDAERTRYYLDAKSGALLRRVDRNDRWYRWLFGGLHRIDFTGWLRARPLWDSVVLVLMLGGLGVAVTGFYLTIRRIRGDLLQLWCSLVRRRMANNSAGRHAAPK
jgi:uncharacterized iron-regulated membrane protein